MFTIFVLYAGTWVSFRMYRENYIKAAALISVGSVVLAAVYIKLGKDPYWYNTLMAFPLGFWLSICKERLESFLFRNSRYYLTLSATILIFVLVRTKADTSIIAYEVCSCLWAALVVLLSMKVNVSNPILIFLGKNLYGYYLMHRLVLLFLPFGGIFVIPYLRFVVFIALSTIISWIFNTFADRISTFASKKLASYLYPE